MTEAVTATCKVCFRKIERPEDAVQLRALGRKLFLVHREPCADKAKAFTVSVARRLSLEVASRLETKYPVALGFARTVMDHLRTRSVS